jgi:hypothetical protein
MGQAANRFLGYGVRRTRPPAGWAPDISARVDEICSVSDCVNSRPEGWVERWDYNHAGCYPTGEAALATTRGARGFQLLAYVLVEWKLDASGAVTRIDADTIFTAGDLPREALPGDYVSIGFDVVSRAVDDPRRVGFDCSPLSCNSMAREVTVNRHCLVDDLEVALQLARAWDREMPEPGPFFVVQVLRRGRPSSIERLR